MDRTMFRYWFLPKRWRRWSDSKRFGFLAVLIACMAGLSFLPLLLIPPRIGRGYTGYFELCLGMLFFLVVNVACALTGATLISRERELGSWESLVLTPVGMRTIVYGKWLARTLFTTVSIGLFVPFWLILTGVILYLNDSADIAFFTADGQRPPSWTAIRLGIYLFWLALRILGHALPFVSLGLVVSACSRKTRSAVTVTLTIILLVLPVALSLLFSLSGSGDGGHFLSTFCLWPLFPNDFASYTDHSLLSKEWASDLVADLCWIVVLPTLLLYAAPGLCRRPEREASKQKQKVKPMPHGV